MVSVKALEWFDVSEELEKHRASPPIGPTYIVEDDGFTEGYHVNACQLVLGNFDTLEAAKAAAQADYETRIRSALVARVRMVAGSDSLDKEGLQAREIREDAEGCLERLTQCFTDTRSQERHIPQP